MVSLVIDNENLGIFLPTKTLICKNRKYIRILEYIKKINLWIVNDVTHRHLKSTNQLYIFFSSINCDNFFRKPHKSDHQKKFRATHQWNLWILKVMTSNPLRFYKIHNSKSCISNVWNGIMHNNLDINLIKWLALNPLYHLNHTQTAYNEKKKPYWCFVFPHFFYIIFSQPSTSYLWLNAFYSNNIIKNVRSSSRSYISF